MTSRTIAHRLPLAVAGLALAGLLGACSGSASPSASAAASVAASVAASAEPSVAASSGSSAAPSVAIPSGFNADTELEKQIPDQLGGETLIKLSFKGANFFSQSTGSDAKAIQDMLATIGKSPSDLSVAVGGSPTNKITVGAFRIAGADANQVLPAFLTAATKDTEGAQVSDTNVGGKSAKKLTAPSEDTTYAYAHGDVIFFVELPEANDALLNEAFSKLP